jgi:hypothetical protein
VTRTSRRQNIFRDNRSINDVGITPGDRFQFGVNILSGGPTGSEGYSGAGIFVPAAGPTISQSLSACVPPSTDPVMCARSAGFSASQLNGNWSFEVQSPSGTTATFPLPTAGAIPLTPVAFPASVTITNSPNGINPTISWTLPGGFTPDAFRVQIYDRSHLLANGTADVIHSAILSPTTASYTIPTILSTGQQLIIGDKYSINF